MGGYGEKGNGEMGTCEEFLSDFAHDAPTHRRSHPRLKELFGNPLDIVSLLSMLSLQRKEENEQKNEGTDSPRQHEGER